MKKLTATMNQAELNKYMKEITQAWEHVRKYRNYSISPWVVKKYGYEAVKQDFELRFGKEYYVRKVTLREPNRVKGSGRRGYCEETYYILERKDARGKWAEE